MPETLTKTLRRWQPSNTSASVKIPFVYLRPTEYITQGYEPISMPDCLGELKKRGVQFGVDEEGAFCFDSERLCLTPGLLASLYYWFPCTCPVQAKIDAADEHKDWI